MTIRCFITACGSSPSAKTAFDAIFVKSRDHGSLSNFKRSTSTASSPPVSRVSLTYFSALMTPMPVKELARYFSIALSFGEIMGIAEATAKPSPWMACVTVLPLKEYSSPSWRLAILSPVTRISSRSEVQSVPTAHPLNTLRALSVPSTSSISTSALLALSSLLL